jgi:hypothetical protein
MWLTGRLVPNRKTTADFRRDNGLTVARYWINECQHCPLQP